MRQTQREPSFTEHRDKRHFQTDLTRYFPRQEIQLAFEASESDEDSFGRGPITRAGDQQQRRRERSRPQRSQLGDTFPQVPGAVQASLLNVGMRVRKAVPEGYKTLKASNGAALPSIQTTLLSSSSSTTTTTEIYSVKPPRDPVDDGLQHQRELLPFCGLHKIGGFAEQPVTNVHLYDPNGDKPLTVFPLPAEAFSQPFSTSLHASSNITPLDQSPPNPHNLSKRSWRDEQDDGRGLGTTFSVDSGFVFKIPLKVAEDEVPISPLSETPRRNELSIPLPQPHGSALRPFAQPKTRRQAQPGLPSRMADVESAVYKDGTPDIDMQIENVQGRDGDFDEKDAEFLRPWSTNGREVEMGGL